MYKVCTGATVAGLEHSDFVFSLLIFSEKIKKKVYKALFDINQNEAINFRKWKKIKRHFKANRKEIVK